MLVCAFHAHAFMLDSSEHSGSQLRSSKQPSVTQLNPFPPHPQPPPLFLSCQRGSCALQWAMFWVAEQGARPAQQLPLCIYIICFFHLLFSIDCGLIWTHGPCLASCHFDCGFEFDDVVWDVWHCCRRHDLVWNVAVVLLFLAQPLLPLAPHKRHLLLSVSAWGAARHLERWMCVNSPSLSSARCREGRRGKMKARSKSESTSRSTTLKYLFGMRVVVWCDCKVLVHFSGKDYSFATLVEMAQAAQEVLKDLVELEQQSLWSID